MSKTFSSSYSNLILSNYAFNPIYVASSATITGTATALYGTGIFWTVTNAGTIAGGPAAADSGIWLHAGGLITNTSSGTITGDYSIRLSHGGTVVNYGSVSRAAAPDQLGVARDPRVLGIALRRLALRHGKQFRVIRAADRRLAEGFHAFEPQDGLRGTNGDAELPMAMFHGFGGAMELVLHVGCTSTYLLEAEASIAA